MANFYPGDEATPAQVLALADAYRDASKALVKLGLPGKPLRRAPFRLIAIHAVELYLNAFLMGRGHAPTLIRGWQHDLKKRTELAIAGGLQLRKRTADHLCRLSAGREYVATRYGPERAATMSQLNRLEATLNEVATKVATSVSRAALASARA